MEFKVGNKTDKVRLLRVGQVAELLGISSRSVYRMIGDAQIEALKVRGCLCVTLESVHAYIKREAGLYLLTNGVNKK